MKGLILAAGKGTRMRELSDHLPKPLIPIANKPMLEHTISAMVDAGVREIVLVVSFKHQMVRDHIGDGSALGAQIEYILQEEPSGTGHAVMIAEQLIGNNDFVMVFGDIMTPDRNIHNIVDRFTTDKPQAILSVHRVDDPYAGAAVYVEKGRVTRIIEKPEKGTSTTSFDNAGIFVLRPEVFDMLKQVELSPRGEYELTDIFTQMVDEKRNLQAFQLQGYWHNVSTPEELLNTNRSIIADLTGITSIIADSAETGTAIIGDNVSIGPEVKIGNNTKIENAIISSGADIGADSTIKNAIILANSRIKDQTSIQGTPAKTQIYA
jgi:glucose-1-phosphate thymidylyltransferase long form